MILGLYSTVVKPATEHKRCAIAEVWSLPSTRNYFPGKTRTTEVQLEEQLNSGTIERLERQGNFRLRMYQAELAKNPTQRCGRVFA
jgi:hypothetical protein